VLADAHVHLLGVGDGGSGCVVSPAMRNRLLFRILKWRFGLKDGSVDEGYREYLLRSATSSRFDRIVLFAQDAVYDSRGERDSGRTHLYVPNDYALRLAREHPDRFRACASINPSRRDALEEVDRVADAGAKMVKVHPPIQGIDPGEDRFRPFYRRVIDRRLLLVVHTGHEHSVPIHGQRFGHPARLSTPLEEGAIVVAAHAGTCSIYDAQDFYPAFQEMARRWPNLYADTAILGNVFRLGALRRVAADPVVRSRLIHGSDFPLPSSNLIGRFPGLVRERNLLERDAKIKEAYGVFEESARRGAKLIESPYDFREPALPQVV
jgi:hypothetical protein